MPLSLTFLLMASENRSSDNFFKFFKIFIRLPAMMKVEWVSIERRRKSKSLLICVPPILFKFSTEITFKWIRWTTHLRGLSLLPEPQFISKLRIMSMSKLPPGVVELPRLIRVVLILQSRSRNPLLKSKNLNRDSLRQKRVRLKIFPKKV